MKHWQFVRCTHIIMYYQAHFKTYPLEHFSSSSHKIFLFQGICILSDTRFRLRAYFLHQESLGVILFLKHREICRAKAQRKIWQPIYNKAGCGSIANLLMHLGMSRSGNLYLCQFTNCEVQQCWLEDTLSTNDQDELNNQLNNFDSFMIKRRPGHKKLISEVFAKLTEIEENTNRQLASIFRERLKVMDLKSRTTEITRNCNKLKIAQITSLFTEKMHLPTLSSRLQVKRNLDKQLSKVEPSKLSFQKSQIILPNLSLLRQERSRLQSLPNVNQNSYRSLKLRTREIRSPIKVSPRFTIKSMVKSTNLLMKQTSQLKRDLADCQSLHPPTYVLIQSPPEKTISCKSQSKFNPFAPCSTPLCQDEANENSQPVPNAEQQVIPKLLIDRPTNFTELSKHMQIDEEESTLYDTKEANVLGNDTPDYSNQALPMQEQVVSSLCADIVDYREIRKLDTLQIKGKEANTLESDEANIQAAPVCENEVCLVQIDLPTTLVDRKMIIQYKSEEKQTSKKSEQEDNVVESKSIMIEKQICNIDNKSMKNSKSIIKSKDNKSVTSKNSVSIKSKVSKNIHTQMNLHISSKSATNIQEQNQQKDDNIPPQDELLLSPDIIQFPKEPNLHPLRVRQVPLIQFSHFPSQTNYQKSTQNQKKQQSRSNGSRKKSLQNAILESQIISPLANEEGKIIEYQNSLQSGQKILKDNFDLKEPYIEIEKSLSNEKTVRSISNERINIDKSQQSILNNSLLIEKSKIEESNKSLQKLDKSLSNQRSIINKQSLLKESKIEESKKSVQKHERSQQSLKNQRQIIDLQSLLNESKLQQNKKSLSKDQCKSEKSRNSISQIKFIIKKIHKVKQIMVDEFQSETNRFILPLIFKTPRQVKRRESYCTLSEHGGDQHAKQRLTGQIFYHPTQRCRHANDI